MDLKNGAAEFEDNGYRPLPGFCLHPAFCYRMIKRAFSLTVRWDTRKIKEGLGLIRE
jgi:hypothetical protein